MHFFRRISVKNIDALITIQYIINIDALITIQYINDWVKGLWIYSSCARCAWDRARARAGYVVLGKGSPDLSCMRAGGMAGVPLAVYCGYRWRYFGYRGRQ